MEWLYGLPSLAKLGVIFVGMIALVRLRLNVGWALCIGAVVCGYWFEQTTGELLESVLAAVLDMRYVILVVMIMLVLVLNHTLQQSGQISRIVDTLLQISRRPRTTLVFFPALLGLLPMPGGALFSAPMVEAAGKPFEISDRDKTNINYWFRHIWEYCWPLYPGIILTATFTGYAIGIVGAVQLPLLVLSVVLGYAFFLRHLTGHGGGGTGASPYGPRPVWRFVKEVSPIWLVIVLYAVLEAGMWAGKTMLPAESGVRAAIVGLPKNLMLVAAIVMTIGFTWASNRMGLRAIWHVLWQKDMYANLVIAVGIIVFAGVLSGSGAAVQVARDLGRNNIPLWVVAMILPFVVGAVTGITMNMVSLTYPIILLILRRQGLDHLALAYCALAFACGYAGILITPLHICMVQSNHFFRLNATSTLRQLALPTLGMIVGGLLLFVAYVQLFPLMGFGPGSHAIPYTSMEAAGEALRRALELSR